MKERLSIHLAPFIDCYPRPIARDVNITGCDICGARYPMAKDDPGSRHRWFRVSSNQLGIGSPRYACSKAHANDIMDKFQHAHDNGDYLTRDLRPYELAQRAWNAALTTTDLSLGKNVPSAHELAVALESALLEYPEFAPKTVRIFGQLKEPWDG